MKFQTPKLLLLSVALLASCQGGSEGSSSVDPGASDVSSSTSNVEIDASSPAALIKSLGEVKNYTVQVDLYTTNNNRLYSTHKVYFQETSYRLETETYGIGYIESKDGVYPISTTGNVVRPGEIIEDDNGVTSFDLWNDGYFESFADFAPSFLEGHNEELFEVKDKKGRLALLDMADLDAKNYPSLREVQATISEGSLGISAYILIDGRNYTIKWNVLDILSTNDEVVNNYLEDGGTSYQPDGALSKAKELFKGRNFTHLYENEAGDVIAYERFHPDYYFLTCGNQGFQNGLIPSGMVGLSHKKSPTTGKELNGCYSVSPSAASDGEVITAIQVNEAFAYNSSTSDVSVAYNYPNNLMLWDSLEFVNEKGTPLHEDYESCFETSNLALVYDFVNNVGAGAVFENAGLTPVALDLETKNIESDGNEEVLFTIIANSGQGMEFRFVDFGTTEVPLMDQWLESLEDF